MKYSAAILAVAGLVAAQSASDFFPACAIECLDAAVASSTTCSLSDGACQCTAENQSAIQTAATSCVIGACGAEVALNEVIPAAAEFCAAVAAGGSATTTAEPTTAAPTSAEDTSAAPTSAEETETATTMDTSTTPAPTATESGGESEETTSTVVTAGAAQFGSMGGLAAFALGALAVF